MEQRFAVLNNTFETQFRILMYVLIVVVNVSTVNIYLLHL